MKFSMVGQEKDDLLIQVLLNRYDRMGRFDYLIKDFQHNG